MLTPFLRDFPVPDSLLLQLANAPTPIFFTSYALDALPQLNGSLNYVTTSEPLVVSYAKVWSWKRRSAEWKQSM